MRAFLLSLLLALPCFGATYYVRTDGHDTASGANNTTDASTGAWLTIQHGTNAASGDTVLVGAGAYNERVGVRNNGITFRTNGPVAVSVWKGWDIGGTNITVDGFDISWTNGTVSDAAIHIQAAASNVVVKGCYIHDTSPTSGMAVGAIMFDHNSTLASAGPWYCVITNNTIERCLSWFGTVELTGTGQLFVGNTIRNIPGDLFHIWGASQTIRGNYVTNVYCDSVIGGHVDLFQTYGNVGSDSHDVLIENNQFVNCLDGPGAVGSCSLGQLESRDYSFTDTNNITLPANGITNFEYSVYNYPGSLNTTNTVTASASARVWFNQQYFAGYAWGTDVAEGTGTSVSWTNINPTKNSPYFIGVSNTTGSPITVSAGVQCSDPGNSTNIRDGSSQLLWLMKLANIGQWTVRNNLFVNVGAPTSIDIPGFYAFNNTYIRCNTNSAHVLSYGYSDKGWGTDGKAFNNVFYLCGLDPANNQYGWYNDAALSDNYGITTNLFDWNLVIGTGAGTTKHSGGARSTFNWAELYGTNGIDPTFQNTNITSGFQPQAASWCIAHGTNLSASFTSDGMGMVRPASGGWTVGAFESSDQLVKWDWAESMADRVTDVTGNGHHIEKMQLTNWNGVYTTQTNWIYQTNYGGRYAGRFTITDTNENSFVGSQDYGWGTWGAMTNTTGVSPITNLTLSWWAWYYGATNTSPAPTIFDAGFNGETWSGQTWSIKEDWNAGVTAWVTQFSQNRTSNAIKTQLYWNDNSTYLSGRTEGWHFYAMTVAGSNMVSYLDGVQVGTGTLDGGYLVMTNSHSAGLIVGAINHDCTPAQDNGLPGGDIYPNTLWFNGLLGEVTIRDRVLSAIEVLSLFSGGTSPTGSTPTPPAATNFSIFKGNGTMSGNGTLQ